MGSGSNPSRAVALGAVGSGFGQRARAKTVADPRYSSGTAQLGVRFTATGP
jgi:hypothetical protein